MKGGQLFLLLFSSLLLSGQGNLVPLSFLTWNIRYDEVRDGTNQWMFRKQEVYNYIISPVDGNAEENLTSHYSGPLVFGIQEGLYHQVQYIDSLLTGYRYVGCGRDDGRQGGEYCALFYQTDSVTLLSEGTFWLSDTPDIPSRGWDAALPRICTYAYFQHTSSGRKFWVFNCHLDHMGATARKESVKLMTWMAEKKNFRREPMVLMGDFNTNKPSDFNPLQSGGWQDCWGNSPNRKGPEGTFHGFGKEDLTRRIDYIFVRGFTCIQSVQDDRKRMDGGFLSDHLPVSAVVRFD